MEGANTSSLGLTKVVLYKHGIGYFERRGKVTGPTKIDLVCEASEIDDMLKSLLAIAGNGRIDAVTYDSSKTLESRLAEFGFNISNCEGLSALLAQIKGIPVTITASGEAVSGRVLGTDASEQVVNEHVVREEHLTVYTEESSFKRVALSAITSIKVDDEVMAAELKQQLELLFQNAKKKDRKALSVVLSEEGETDVLIAYSIPCPIWKTSYRLVMHDASRVMLQGMAIVDNMQEEDWDAVQIVLVSASPISFIQPLYHPVLPARQVIAAQGNNSSGPVVAERAQRKRETVRAKTENTPMPMSMAAPASGGMGTQTGSFSRDFGAAFDEVSSVGGLSQAMANQFTESISVETGEKGELFEYRINKPVTVPRNSSALIPIVQQDIEGERISLYNQQKNAKFPHAAIRFVNNTGLTLEGGPVTIMEGDIYAGEALLDTTKPDDKRFLLYAVDQACPVVTRVESQSKPFWRIRSLNGTLCADFYYSNQNSYEVENLGEQKKIVYVEHPINQNWKLVSKVAPQETTQNYYRFRLEVAPKSMEVLTVTEETECSEEICIYDANSINPTRINYFCSQNFMSEEFKKFLKTILERQAEMRQTTAEAQLAQQMHRQYVEDQNRAKEILKTVGANNERYRKTIDTTEDLITATNKNIQALQVQYNEQVKRFYEFAQKQFISELESK